MNYKKDFKNLKKQCNKRLFGFFESNSMKSYIKSLEFNDINYKNIKFIVTRINNINDVRDNDLIYDLIYEILKSNKDDKCYKLFECKNYLENNRKNLKIKKHILYSIVGDYIDKEIFDKYLKLINNKIFLESNDALSLFKSSILKMIDNLSNNKCFDSIYEISTSKNFWDEYKNTEKLKIIKYLEDNLDCEKTTKFIATLINKMYFKDEYNVLNNEILLAYEKSNPENLAGLQTLIENIDAETFNKNKEQLYKIIKLIRNSKNEDESINYANMGIKLFKVENSLSKNNKDLINDNWSEEYIIPKKLRRRDKKNSLARDYKVKKFKKY